MTERDKIAKVPLHGTAGVVGFALIDAADLPLVAGFRWHLSGGYAKAYRESGPRSNRCRRTFYMHTVIAGERVDHRDRDRLNNRRSNLRVATQAQNSENLTARANLAGGLRGVGWDGRRGKWQARVRGKHLGRFDTPGEAAQVAAAERARTMPFSEEGS